MLISLLPSFANQRASLSPPARNWIPSFQAFLLSPSLPRLLLLLLVYKQVCPDSSATIVWPRTGPLSRGLSFFIFYFSGTLFGTICFISVNFCVDAIILEDTKVALEGGMCCQTWSCVSLTLFRFCFFPPVVWECSVYLSCEGQILDPFFPCNIKLVNEACVLERLKIGLKYYRAPSYTFHSRYEAVLAGSQTL